MPKIGSLLDQCDSEIVASARARPELLAALPRNRWLLASLLQKAVRRGRADYSAAASTVLVEMVPQYLARRLPVIAYEEIGVADPSLLLWVKQAARQLTYLPIGDRRSFAALIAVRMAQSTKSRTACDIVSIIESSPDTTVEAEDLVDGNLGDWVATVANRQAPLLRRAIALRFALGLGVSGFRPSKERIDKLEAYDALATAMHLPASLMAAVRSGGQTHSLHSALPLAHDLLYGETSPVVRNQADLSGQGTASHGVLLCAVDMYTRFGRNAYQRLVRGHAALRGMLDEVANGADPVAVVGMLLFHVEGSLLDRPLVSPASTDLLAALEALEARRVGVRRSDDAESVRQWLRDNIDVVEHHRIQALAHYLRPNSVRAE